MRQVSPRRRLLAGLAAALAIAAAGSSAASGSAERSPQASASAARCSATAFPPTQRNGVLAARGRINCGGAVAKQKLRTCLEQQVRPGGRYATVECERRVKLGPGKMVVVVRHHCAAAAERRAFRTSAFLFLKDKSGGSASKTLRSGAQDYPRHCS